MVMGDANTEFGDAQLSEEVSFTRTSSPFCRLLLV
jgi:hypothetical protein